MGLNRKSKKNFLASWKRETLFLQAGLDLCSIGTTGISLANMKGVRLRIINSHR